MKEFVQLALRHSRAEGEPIQPTKIPQLGIARSSTASLPLPVVYQPSLCYIVQGAKEVTVGERVLRYSPSQYLISTVEVPATGEILEASAAKPYLCFVLTIEPKSVYELLQASPAPIDRGSTAQDGVFVARSEAALSEAMLRLARCLDDEDDCSILAPGIIREILYRLLRSEISGVIHELGTAGSRTQRVGRAIEHLKTMYREPVAIEALARIAGMSVSSFHEHFKRATALSPHQYQKRLRLHEARRLLMAGAETSAEIGFRVGYESASQFTREYAKLFGAPPRRDAERLRAEL